MDPGSKKPTKLDILIGQRIRIRRELVGMSQEELGELLGVSFQQIQKYEKCQNRVSASRLAQIAVLLQVPVTYFLDEQESGAPQIEEDSGGRLANKQRVELLRAFNRITDKDMRQAIVDVAGAAAKQCHKSE